MADLSKEMTRLREQAGLRSQGALAKEMDVAKNRVWSYEKGKTLPDIDFLAEFARITGADLHQLINLRLEAGGFSPLQAGVRDSLGDYVVADSVDCAAHARRALLEAEHVSQAWALAIMEMAARGEISPAGVDRLIGFISDHLDAEND